MQQDEEVLDRLFAGRPVYAERRFEHFCDKARAAGLTVKTAKVPNEHGLPFGHPRIIVGSQKELRTALDALPSTGLVVKPGKRAGSPYFTIFPS